MWQVGVGRAGCQSDGSPRGKSVFVLSKGSKKPCLNVRPEANKNRSPFFPMQKQTLRLTTNSSPVHHWFSTCYQESDMRFVSWLLTSGPGFFVRSKHFHARHVLERTCRANNQKDTQAGLIRAQVWPHDGVAQGWALTEQLATEISVASPASIEDSFSGLFAKKNG